MATTEKNEVLTLEQKKEQLIAKHNADLKIALEVLEKKEKAEEQKTNVNAEIAKQFDNFKNAIATNSSKISSLIAAFDKEYHTSYYANAGEARDDIKKRHAKELNELNKQHTQERQSFKARYQQDFDLFRQVKTGLTLSAKQKQIAEIMVNGKPKYKLNADKTELLGAKGEPITSTINEKIDNKKETLSAKNLFKYLKPDYTDEDLKQFEPKVKGDTVKGGDRLEQFNDMIQDTDKTKA